MQTTHDLIQLLELQKVDDTTFVGNSITVGSPNVFGGQVLAQALNAAQRTITNGRILHSMHGYFLEPGNLEIPITYKVGIIRDGGSFSTRRITAIQNKVTIFILAASFQREEHGHTHQIEVRKDIKQPESLLSWTDVLNKYGDHLPKTAKSFLEIKRPVVFKPTEFLNPFDRKDLPPVTDVWFKLNGDTNDLSLAIKQQILTYISDYNILSVAIHPHASKAHWGNLQTASLDHSMWYFRDFDFDDWMLYSLVSPSTSNARGFARGNIFTRKGELVASVAQEGLMRPRN